MLAGHFLGIGPCKRTSDQFSCKSMAARTRNRNTFCLHISKVIYRNNIMRFCSASDGCFNAGCTAVDKIKCKRHCLRRAGILDMEAQIYKIFVQCKCTIICFCPVRICCTEPQLLLLNKIQVNAESGIITECYLLAQALCTEFH